MVTGSSANADRVVPLNLTRNMTFAAPVVLFIPVAFAILLGELGAALHAGAIGFGALGWLVAFVLRAPVSLFIRQRQGTTDRARSMVIGSSGPLEEGVRLIALLLIGRDFSHAASIGIGWATTEAFYVVSNGFMTINLLKRTDPHAIQARELLSARGMLRAPSPALEIIERVAATALHIGFTLLTGWRLLMVLVNAALRSAAHLALVRGFKSAPLASELLLLVFGIATFVLGLAAYGQL